MERSESEAAKLRSVDKLFLYLYYRGYKRSDEYSS
uniref:Uncharacterized protein n=1 Tax=viral metagenome TaxID=1070528 RepID=A0A6C0CF38_9ZZZZ